MTTRTGVHFCTRLDEAMGLAAELLGEPGASRTIYVARIRSTAFQLASYVVADPAAWRQAKRDSAGGYGPKILDAYRVSTAAGAKS